MVRGHTNKIGKAYAISLVSVPNKMLDDILNDNFDTENVFNNDENVDSILKVLNMYNGALQTKACHPHISKHAFDLFCKFKKFESTNEKLKDMKNAFRKLSFSFVLQGDGFKDLYPMLKVIHNDGENAEFLSHFFEWIKYYSQQVETLETISEEEMFKLKIAWSIVNNYGHEFMFGSYYYYAKVIFDVVAKSDIEISDEFMRHSFNLHDKIENQYQYLKRSNLPDEVVSEVGSGLKEFRNKILKLALKAFDRNGQHFIRGYRDMVLGDIINDYFGLNEDIINLISSLLKHDQCDHFLWFGLYESALTRLVDGNLTHENFYNENELLLNLVKSRGELSHLHPDLFKIVMDRIIFVLNHGSRNVSSAGLEALNTLLERFSNYDFNITRNILLERFPSLEKNRLQDIVNGLVNIENDFEQFRDYIKEFATSTTKCLKPKTINKSIHEPRVNSDELLTDGGIKMARPKTDRKCKAKNETQQEKGNGAKTGIMIVGSIACRLVLLLRAAKLVYRSIRNLIN
ncbi:hypothetical protein ROZALSC1DRAFT_24760 [Rozella allomycis CSF55]|uniref:Exportin-1 C-terminal domain-containing protein n=1 Tax=Rozella allomycis (strain CSF55) TaxID=988480 RepID=A0A4P9YCV4_ROZAC|nr:hypothetical protein ROZALSC1DRAFT_24760 [Rozella allomycis CSF55]